MQLFKWAGCKSQYITAVLLFFSFPQYLKAQIPEDLVEVEISSESDVIKPGESTWLLLSVKVQDGWHMYWKNAGESGYPTTLEWEVDSATIGPLMFPSPKPYDFLGMVIYVHEKEFVLLNKLSLDDDFEAGNDIEINGKLSTLVCNEENCLPYDIDVSVKIPTAFQTKINSAKSLQVKQAQSMWPTLPNENTDFSAKASGESIRLQVSHPLIAELDSDLFYFFPINEYFGHTLNQVFNFDKENGSLSWNMPLNTEISPPTELSGVLRHPSLRSGWNVTWKMNEVQYGTSAVDKATGPVTYKAVQDDMGVGVLLLMLGMVVVAFAVWIYGKGRDPGVSAKAGKRYLLISCLVGLFGIWMGFPSKDVPSDQKIEWGVWSPELEEELKSAGKAVYVDYTARWCASCIANKRAYTFDSMIDLFKEKDIVALRADWTDRGPVILDSLQSYGRFGVPLNVYHPSGANDGADSQPVLLPEILTRKNIREAIEDGKVSQDAEELSFWAILGFAALGGVILNLMPCVFPVIGLKVMSFVKQAGEDPAQIKKHGLVFTLGVVLSFWILVGVLLGLRESLSEDLGWGFQLQEPVFVFILAIFLLIFAMSLSGIFEIGMSFTGVGSKLTQKDGLSSSFFSGVLATVVATPCMAPFLGVAVGAALTMTWLPAYTIFTSVALGLSAPYLILSIFPKWMSRLPKPGAWMDTFKQAMAFPLYGTVIWLVWTLQSLL